MKTEHEMSEKKHKKRGGERGPFALAEDPDAVSFRSSCSHGSYGSTHFEWRGTFPFPVMRARIHTI